MTLLATAPISSPDPSFGVDAPVGADSPAGATPRSFFDGCDTVYELERYVHPCGPANPMSRTMADVVREVAERAA